jgi:hypothetical protein
MIRQTVASKLRQLAGSRIQLGDSNALYRRWGVA